MGVSECVCASGGGYEIELLCVCVCVGITFHSTHIHTHLCECGGVLEKHNIFYTFPSLVVCMCIGMEIRVLEKHDICFLDQHVCGFHADERP